MDGAIRQQAITWTNIDKVLYCYMVPLGYNELFAILVHVLTCPKCIMI